MISFLDLGFACVSADLQDFCITSATGQSIQIRAMFD